MNFISIDSLFQDYSAAAFIFEQQSNHSQKPDSYFCVISVILNQDYEENRMDQPFNILDCHAIGAIPK